MSEKLSLLPNLAASDGRETVGRLASEAKAVGENVGRLMSGLDRRVRESLDPVLGQRRPLTVVGAAGLALALGGAVVSKPMAKNTTLRSGLAAARLTASSGE